MHISFLCMTYIFCCWKFDILNKIMWSLWKIDLSLSLGSVVLVSLLFCFSAAALYVFCDFPNFVNSILFVAYALKSLFSFISGQLIIRQKLPQCFEPRFSWEALCACWDMPSKLQLADYNSILSFPVCLCGASRQDKSEKSEPFHIFTEYAHSPAHTHDFLNFKEYTGGFEAHYTQQFCNFSF